MFAPMGPQGRNQLRMQGLVISRMRGDIGINEQTDFLGRSTARRIGASSLI
jgi:hypothetical protein